MNKNFSLVKTFIIKNYILELLLVMKPEVYIGFR